MSEGTFIVWQPAGYGLDLSFHPGTSMDDVPVSMVMNKAKELLSDDALQKLRGRIENTGSYYCPSS